MSRESIDNLEATVESIEKDFNQSKDVSIIVGSTLLVFQVAKANPNNAPFAQKLEELEIRLKKMQQ